MFWWAWAAGLAWEIFALFGGMYVLLFLLSFWGFLPGLAFAVPALVCPAWFVHNFWYRRSPAWAAVATLFGTGFVVAGVLLRFDLFVFPFVIPTILSAIGARELQRRTCRQTPDATRKRTLGRIV